MNLDFIERLKKSDDIVAKFDDITGGMADTIRSECGILSVEKMQEEIENIAQENRLLSIGIIGRVKAGKSSLLNALFFNGKEILPKAATPMTAALTIIKYSENPYAEVEFFTKSDILTIEKEHDDFSALKKRIFEEKLEAAKENAGKRKENVDETRIERAVERELDENPKKGSWDQYERMKKSGIMENFYNSSFSEVMKLDSDSLENLIGKLNDYVGSSGKYMPFTKSVVLYLNIPELKDIQIVDTPGINDPVKSREKRTEDYLGQCDVVFVVSPAGEFISEDDLDLMAHVSGKKGVGQVFLVASRSDQQLYGSIKDDAKGSFTHAVELIKSQLSSHAREVFAEKRKINPESKEMYDSLINDMENRVIITSSICHAILQNINNSASWDEDMNFNWDRLLEEYPDFFEGNAAISNLKLISGVEKVKANIEKVRNNKNEIIESNQKRKMEQYQQNIESFISGIKNAVQENAERLQNTDAAELKEKKKMKENLRVAASVDVDDAFETSIIQFKTDLSSTLKQHSHGLFNDVSDFSSFQKEETKSRQVAHKRIKGTGFLNWISGGRFGNETVYETRSYTVRTIQSAPVKQKLNYTVQELQEDLEVETEKAVIEWKQNVQSKTINALRANIDADDIDIPLVKTSIRRVVGNMEIPEFNLSAVKFSGEYSGILKDDNVDKFLEAVNDYVYNLRSEYSSQIRKFLKEMTESAKKEKLSSLLFESMDKELSELEKQIENKESTLERYKMCIAELAVL